MNQTLASGEPDDTGCRCQVATEPKERLDCQLQEVKHRTSGDHARRDHANR